MCLQIRVEPDDTFKVTYINATFGLLEYIRIPFGIRNPTQTIGRFIEQVTCGLPVPFTNLYDLFVANLCPQEHEHHLNLLLQRLQESGIAHNAMKCIFGVPQLAFLGHMKTSSGIQPLHSKVDVIR